MKITAKQIAEGWKLTDDVWIAPIADCKLQEKEFVKSPNERRKPEPSWIKVPLYDPGAQVVAFRRFGLSNEESEVAAGVKDPPPRNDMDPYKELRLRLRSGSRD